uniref:Variant surface glycoprotein 1125.5315 n=1 Tax=Trypanosoma brucei TaxID=5691 RepID=A0A1J0RC26_9TRYP|nr:variant surface glycoprotein 1125.5315 [Trypanosoma brucei]
MTKICAFNSELKSLTIRVASILTRYVGVIQRLQNLDGDLQMLLTEDHMNGSEWLRIISLVVKTTTTTMIKALHTNAETAVYAAATCNLFAGRIENFVGIFKAAIGSTNYCIDKGRAAYNHKGNNKLAGCLEESGKLTSFAEKTLNTQKKNDGAFKTAMGTQADFQTATNKGCMLTQYGSNGGESYAENDNHKDTLCGNGLFKVAHPAEATHTDWPHYGKKTVDGTDFGHCKAKMTLLEQQLADPSRMETSLLNLDTKNNRQTPSTKITFRHQRFSGQLRRGRGKTSKATNSAGINAGRHRIQKQEKEKTSHFVKNTDLQRKQKVSGDSSSNGGS